MGSGTRKDPGGDYSFLCVIEAESEEEAFEWGHRVHGNFLQGRWQFTDTPHDDRPCPLGEIDSEENVEELVAKHPEIAQCKIGEIPVWSEPWKNAHATSVRLADN